MKRKINKIIKNHKMQQAFLSMKPDKTIWGILGIIFFFFLPEIVAYFWGIDIVKYAQDELIIGHGFIQQNYFKFLIYTFEDGVSLFNIIFGFILLIWLFF